MACIRIDYMGDESPELVEYNLMSVGLNGMSDAIQRLAQLYKKNRTTQEVFYPESKNQVTLLDAISYTLKDKKLNGIILMVVH